MYKSKACEKKSHAFLSDCGVRAIPGGDFALNDVCRFGVVPVFDIAGTACWPDRCD